MFDFMKGMSVWLILKQCAYYFLFVLVLWGGKNKFGTKEFHDDYASLDTMKSLRGFAAIGVILHHISQETLFQESKVLSGFVNAGAYFVALFFFCSGYGLIKSLNTKENYLKGFVKNRIVKSIMLPFYVNVLIYGLYLYISKVKMPAAQWICNFTGLTMMNQYAWFPIVLTILYFAFFFTFRFIKKRPICFAVIFLVIIGMGLAFSYNGHFAWWSGSKNWWLDWNHPDTTWWKQQKVLWFNGEWWVNSSIAFLVGLIFANYEKALVGFFQKFYALKLHIVMVLALVAYKLSDWAQSNIGYWTEYMGKGPGVYAKMKTYFCQLPLFILVALLAVLLLMKYHASNPVTRFFGKFSLDTYLMNLMAIEMMRFLQKNSTSPIKANKYNLLIYALGVFAVTVILGVAEYYITYFIKKVLFPKKKKKEEVPA
ncbi:MAG: acyltransferase family protein [Clostridiales bacterium]|nr:acyltransferase family protein [Clostridiales bacterium]